MANSHQSGINSPKTEAAVAPPAQTDDATEQDPEARQTEEDNAIVEASILVDRVVDQLENVEDSNEDSKTQMNTPYR